MTPDEKKILVGNVTEYRTPAQDGQMDHAPGRFRRFENLG